MVNEKLINLFEKLIDQIKYEIANENDKNIAYKHTFRLKHIQHTLKIIKSFKTNIKSSKELEDIKGIGKGSLERIDEILKTGKLKELQNTEQDDEFVNSINELAKVIGIGPVTAKKLVKEHNIKSVKELIKAHKLGKIELNNQILTGLKFHGVYQENIPRKEMDQINNFVGDVARKLDPELLITICGSYRRLKMSSNDIDVLLVHPKINSKEDIVNDDNNYLIRYVKELLKVGFIVDSLTYMDYRTEYMGFCKIGNNPIRRIDIQFVPYDSYYPALVYFTGSGNFNQRMRQVAKLQGYILNQYGLYKIKNHEQMIVNSEKDIFDILGMEYLEPVNRM